MEHVEDTNVAGKIKVLAQHLVASFPQASILFREIGVRCHLFVIVSYAGGPEKTIQVDRAVLDNSVLTTDEFASRVGRLHLPTVLKGCARYDLGPDVWSSVGAGETDAQACSQNRD